MGSSSIIMICDASERGDSVIEKKKDFRGDQRYWTFCVHKKKKKKKRANGEQRPKREKRPLFSKEKTLSVRRKKKDVGRREGEGPREPRKGAKPLQLDIIIAMPDSGEKKTAYSRRGA